MPRRSRLDDAAAAGRSTRSNLGALLALYEHRTFVEGMMMGINAFDQWGVELGKMLAKPIIAALEDPSAPDDAFDASTRSLIGHVRDLGQ